MWDFDIGRTLGIMLRTMPFILLRIAVYVFITLAYIVAIGFGAGIGFGVGHVVSGVGAAGAGLGGILGFLLVSALVYWIREYILYVVKAGHIAVMVRLIDGQDIPGGQGQIAYAREAVEARFAETNVLFAVDQLVKGAIRAVTGLIGGVAAFLPIPGLDGLVRFLDSVVRLSLTYVDEIILGYNMRLGSSEPFETARQGVVLYAQNAWVMVRNALWLAVFMWVIALVIFLVMLAPAAAILYAMPGELAGWSFVLAIVFAWAIKAALVEPFCIAALMEVYFRTIEGQVPDPQWDRRLAEASRQFRELKDRAVDAFGGLSTAAAQPG